MSRPKNHEVQRSNIVDHLRDPEPHDKDFVISMCGFDLLSRGVKYTRNIDRIEPLKTYSCRWSEIEKQWIIRLH